MELPLHPKLVHLPIALAVLMPLLAAVLSAALRRGWLPMRSWLLAVGAQALLFGSSLLAMRSGEADEDRVEPFVPEIALEAHEEAAERFTWVAGLLLLLSLSPLLLHRRRRVANWCTLATTAGTLGVLWLGYQVGQAGGELVYRHGGASAFATGDPSSQRRMPPVRGGEDDDH